MITVVPELDVLLPTLKWLAQEGVKPTCVSVSAGSAAGIYADRDRVQAVFNELGIADKNCWMINSGPDIVGIGNGDLWLIECKGAGTGASSTHRNNFDRALASVVSYYDYNPPNVDTNSVKRLIIGLALPATTIYTRQLKQRVGHKLRARLDLWIFLVQPNGGAVSVIQPEEQYQF